MLEYLLNTSIQFWPAALTLLIFGAAVWVNDRWYRQEDDAHTGHKFRRQLIGFLLVFVGLITFLVVLPLAGELRGQLLALVGIVVSAAIALSSTTLLGNMMAGIMLRLIRDFRAGDFLSVGDRFGRVSEMGLLHTEIQSEDRDLITLPNLYLINNSYKVVRSSGTIVSASCSIGYDVHHAEVQRLLLQAAEAAGLQEAFVHVMELGNYSVTYRVAGLLTEIKQLLSTRSRLRTAVLDALHGAGIEIMSPLIQAQRQLPGDVRMLPVSRIAAAPPPDDRAEAVAFDKADEAEDREALKLQREVLVREIEALELELKTAEGDALRADLENRLRLAHARNDYLKSLLARTDESG